MNINIISFNRPFVRFSSPVGIGEGIWKDDLPNIKESYHIEFDINDIFEWNRNICGTNQKVSGIEIIGDKLVFVAELINHESDKICTVSLGGSIILLEMISDINIKCDYVRFYAPLEKVNLYPYNV